MSGEAKVEWGVRHSQGIRTEPSEAAARESLAWMAAKKRQYGVMEPYIVCRTVTPWLPAASPVTAEANNERKTK